MMNFMMMLGNVAKMADMIAYLIMYNMVGLGFFSTAVDGLKTVVTAIGAGFGV